MTYGLFQALSVYGDNLRDRTLDLRVEVEESVEAHL